MRSETLFLLNTVDCTCNEGHAQPRVSQKTAVNYSLRIGGTKLCYSAVWLMQDAWRENSFLAFRSLLLFLGFVWFCLLNGGWFCGVESMEPKSSHRWEILRCRPIHNELGVPLKLGFVDWLVAKQHESLLYGSESCSTDLAMGGRILTSIIRLSEWSICMVIVILRVPILYVPSPSASILRKEQKRFDHKDLGRVVIF